jgi:hypothetical protein
MSDYATWIAAFVAREEMRSGGRPKGVLPVTDTMRACARLHVEGGESHLQLAKLYGVSHYTIDSWIARVRDAEKDARNLAHVGRP